MMADQQEQQPQQDEEEQQQGTTTESAIRFPAWVALSVLSVVAWVAMIGRRHEMNSSEKWALSVTTLSMVLGILSTLSYLYARHLFTSQLPEIVMAGLILALWSAGLPVIMNPSNSIAVGFTQVVNANLYFSTWATFLCSLWISGSLVKELYGLDVLATATPIVKSKQGKWYALVASSLIVMGASIRVFRAFDCTLDVMAKAPTCRQSKFAIAAGTIGTLCAALITLSAASGRVKQEHEWLGSLLMLIIWCFGLGYITFGEGPGHAIGNLYFATWASFVLSVLLFAEGYREYLGLREQAQNQEANVATEDLSLQEEGLEEEDI